MRGAGAVPLAVGDLRPREDEQVHGVGRHASLEQYAPQRPDGHVAGAGGAGELVESREMLRIQRVGGLA